MCEYTVIRSNRKKFKLELSPDGLVIKAPYAMTDDQIAQIVREKSDWITEHTADGTEFTKRKWIGAGSPVPGIGTAVKVIYDEEKPSKAKIIC